MIYVICFGISTFFAYIAKQANRRYSFIVFSVLSILVTTLLAGFRGLSVGIDTANYFYGSWTRAISSISFSQFFDAYRYSSERFEILYVLIIGAIANWTGNFQILLFVMHLVIISGIYIGAFRMREHADPVLTLLLFYLLYYNHSLNITRQYMAMAIIFAAAADLEQGKILRYLFFIFVAFMIHNTGLLGLIPLMIYVVLYPKKRLDNVPFRRRVIIGALIVLVLFAFVPFVQFLISRGILSRYYATYFLDTEAAIPKVVILFLIIEAVSLFLMMRELRRNDSHADFFLFCSVAFILIYQLATVISYGKRIAAYFSFLNIVTIGMLPESQKRINFNSHIIRALVIFFALAYWIYCYAYQNNSQTFPYVLGI